MTSDKRKQLYRHLARQQEEWVREHGCDRTGYYAHYATYGRPKEEIDDIFRADINELVRLRKLAFD